MTVYCLKEKRRVEIENPRPVTLRNRKPAMAGTCPHCGTRVFKLTKSSDRRD